MCILWHGNRVGIGSDRDGVCGCFTILRIDIIGPEVDATGE
jgi:hypothetical protein